MFNQPGTHGHSVGLSVGATNIAGTRDGHTAAIHPAEVTLHGQRFTGFVDRVGDPVPLIAPDGSNHRPEKLLAEALGAVAQSATEGVPASDVAITVPAHWRPSVVETLRQHLHDGLAVVSDATAALTALSANPGLPTRGVIVLCDFGGSGSSITLANASANFAVVGETVRFADFSGDHIDQALLTHVVSGLDGSQADPFGTAMVGSLTALRDECRRAKERLSAQTATAVAVDVPGHRTDIRVTRLELEDLMQAPIASFLAALDDTLERYGVPTASVSAVATVGGGARIPLVTQRLSEYLRAPVVTTPHPQLTAAEGAALIAARSGVTETATTLAPAAGLSEPTATFDAGQPSTTFGALAWSDDAEDELPYTDAAMDTDYYQRPTDSRPELHFSHDEWPDEAPERRAPLVLFGLSAVAAVLTAAVFALMQLTGTTTPVEAATTSVAPSPAPAAPVKSPAPPAPQAPQVTTVVVQPAQRANPQPRQAPVTQQPVVVPTTPPPTTTPPTTTEPTTTPPTEPTPPPPPVDPPTEPSTPPPPPIDPGPGNGGDAGTPPIDPGDGAGDTGLDIPAGDPGQGTGGTDTGTPPADPGTGDAPAGA